MKLAADGSGQFLSWHLVLMSKYVHMFVYKSFLLKVQAIFRVRAVKSVLFCAPVLKSGRDKRGHGEKRRRKKEKKKKKQRAVPVYTMREETKQKTEESRSSQVVELVVN